MSDVFKAISDPTRREILVMLVQNPCSINSIAEKFDMSRPAISKHIKVLTESSLVKIEVDGSDARQRNCRIQLEALQEVDIYLSKLQEFWEHRLDELDTFLKKGKKTHQ